MQKATLPSMSLELYGIDNTERYETMEKEEEIEEVEEREEEIEGKEEREEVEEREEENWEVEEREEENWEKPVHFTTEGVKDIDFSRWHSGEAEL